jgi:hypothetical protein
VGYVPLDQMTAHFVFSLVCRRYEKGATIWTSNKSFAEWAGVFAGDEVVTAAILDRLLHHGTVANIRGQSCRLKDKLKTAAANTAPSPPTSTTPRKVSKRHERLSKQYSGWGKLPRRF